MNFLVALVIVNIFSAFSKHVCQLWAICTDMTHSPQNSITREFPQLIHFLQSITNNSMYFTTDSKTKWNLYGAQFTTDVWPVQTSCKCCRSTQIIIPCLQELGDLFFGYPSYDPFSFPSSFKLFLKVFCFPFILFKLPHCSHCQSILFFLFFSIQISKVSACHCLSFP